MARQLRSEATRRKILDAAIAVFSEVGYAAAGWGTIIERTGMTKGALYHHFDSRDALASAIIEEGSEILLSSFRSACGSASPALENMIHGTFAVANVLSSNAKARTAEELAAALCGFNEAASRFAVAWVDEIAAQARRAMAEGDLRDDIDPELVSQSIVGIICGTRLLSHALSTGGWDDPTAADLGARLTRIWGLLLPGIASQAALPYFQQYLAREALRHVEPTASAGVPTVVPETV